ncbi:hypothetical protein ACLBWS_05805 [Brucellaceae bacterium D45D]
MTLLASLPAREASNAEAVEAAYFIALEGVSFFALETATKSILRNGLGHPFFPSPPELRQECDKVMKPILEARARDHRDAEILKEQREEREARKSAVDSWTDESRARASSKWQQARAKIQADSASEQAKRGQYDTSPEAAMARLKQRAEENEKEFHPDKLPNGPRDTFKQVGRAA